MKIEFYKETEFKDTEIGRIPKDWEVSKLKEVLLLLRNGLTGEQNKEEKGYPITRIETISEERINPNKLGYISQVSEKDLQGYKLLEGDILFSHINSLEHIGKTAIYEGVPDFLLHGMNLLLLRPNKNKVYPKYLLYFLRLSRKRKIFWAMAKKAVNQASINQTELGKMKIVLPPLPEQQKIAEILSTVDEAIQKTNEVIAKTERLKKGLMQELLTKGIGHKEFKDTEIGKIPKEWEVIKLEDACLEITDGSHWSPKEVEKSEYRIATVANLRETYIDINSCKFISEEDYIRLVNEGDIPRRGDILFSKDGTVGISFAFKQDHYKIGLLSSVAIIRPKPQLLFSDFGAYTLKSPKVFQQIIGLKTGTALRRITLNNLKRVKIPLPSIEEQQKIAEILSTVDKKLEIERNEKAKLERIKQGLMDLLLTGKVRVKLKET
ncbi:MAG: restriction endonuclease subunit S [Archaeoglobaceae archaeon]